MIQNHHRTTLIFLFLALALLASVMYDTILAQTNARAQLVLAIIIAGSLAATLLLQPFPRQLVQPVFIAAWPLHLFTASFFAICYAFHARSQLDQVAIYTLFAYATFVVVPIVFVLNPAVFQAFLQLVAVLSAMLAIPSLFGALGYQSLFGIPLRVKFSYASFSGIIASGGVFEHPEGHAFQMAIGLFCCLYLLRNSSTLVFFPCLLLTSAGLLVSQGRAAIYGTAIAITFMLCPALFRRSRPVFLGSLIFLLTFPFLIWTQLAAIPGVPGYLRLSRGMSGRGEAWRYALTLVQEEPWTGHGFMASTELTEDERKTLRTSGFSGAGTTFHNTFISRAVDLGVIATFLYSLIYLVSLCRVCESSKYPREQELVRSLILLSLTAALFRDYNLGGIRSTAMTSAVFLGLATYWPLADLWKTGGLASSSTSRRRYKAATSSVSQ